MRKPVMAHLSGWRTYCAGIVAALASMTFSVNAPAYFDSGGTATSTFDHGVIVISFTGYSPASDFVLPVIKEQRVASDQRPAFRHHAIKERASRSAVRPTAVSGWRSGRVRTLSA